MKNVYLIEGKIWIPTIETQHVIMSPIRISRKLSLRANAVLLQNNGNCDLILSGGFTLKPDQTYMFGNHSDLAVQKVDITIKFLPDTATSSPVVQELQLVEIITNLTGSGYYIDQPTVQRPN